MARIVSINRKENVNEREIERVRQRERKILNLMEIFGIERKA